MSDERSHLYRVLHFLGGRAMSQDPEQMADSIIDLIGRNFRDRDESIQKEAEKARRAFISEAKMEHKVLFLQKALSAHFGVEFESIDECIGVLKMANLAREAGKGEEGGEDD